ncbi:hypothetical protein DFH29DRAFT_231401 [Suillus ampliporus]|nr:hypothetical protein DFH29DRAFT_231401 [Suillus ampliporus]
MCLSGCMKGAVVIQCVIRHSRALQTVDGITYSFLTAVPYRTPGQETGGFVIFDSPTYRPRRRRCFHKAFRRAALLPDVGSCWLVSSSSPFTSTRWGRPLLESSREPASSNGADLHTARIEELLSKVRGGFP